MLLRIPIGAFLLSPGSTQAVEALRDDRMFFHSQIEIVEGGLNGAVSFLSDKRTPSLLIVETVETNHDRLLEQLGQLASVCDPDTRLILIGTVNDVGFYRTLVESGISDYLLVDDIDVNKLKNSIAAAFSMGNEKSGGKVVAFYGVSGGVGSSVIAHNVSHLLAGGQEKRTTLIDLDMHFGTAALDLNIEPRMTLVDAITQFSNLNEELFSQLTTTCDSDLLLIPSPASLNVGLPLDFPVIEALVREAKAISDIVILDIPHGWGPVIDDTIALADDLFLVANPDLSGLRNAKNLIETLGPRRKVDASTRIILNKVRGNKQGEVSDRDFSNALALTPEALIPLDYDSFGRALNDGEMMVSAFPKSDATKAISDLADKVALSTGSKKLGAEKDAGNKKKTGFSFSGLLAGLKGDQKKSGA